MVSSENPQALILFGLNDTTVYAPNPEGHSLRESALLLDLPILTNNANEVRALFVHTVTDAPALDLVTANGDTLVSNLTYGAASQPISLAAGSYSVNLLHSSDKQSLGTHTLDVSSNSNGYVVVALSGFLNPAANQNGPAAALGIYQVQLTPTTHVEEQNARVPAAFALLQNYPNPFSASGMTSIQYAVAVAVGASRRSPVQVSLKVYDILGNEVKTLVNERKPPGIYRVIFEATGLPSGVYFYKMITSDFEATRKMLLIQ